MNKTNRIFEFEMRAEQNAEHGTHITGRPIVYNSETDLGDFREVIEVGALDGADLRDVRLLVNHDTSMIPLARSRRNNNNSTMQLTVDGEGLLFRADLDCENNSTAKALYSAIGRGDITGMSFMFNIDSDTWEDLETDKPLRRINKISRVLEVSAVMFPAYEETTISQRDAEALANARAVLEKAKAEESARRQIEELKEENRRKVK